VQGLGKRYAPRRVRSKPGAEAAALDNVDLELLSNQSLGVVGETGSGKTTLARCILGLERPSEGTVIVDGLNVTRYDQLPRDALRKARSSIQCVFQDPYSSLNPSHSVKYILTEALGRRSGESQLDKRAVVGEIARLLDAVGLPEDYMRRRPVALSGGERQRIAIARAIATDPKILVCDEPVAALDVSVQAQVLEVLREVQRTGVSLLFITHDLAVVRQMTDQLIILHKGVVVEQGATIDVLREPTHAYTRRLIAAVPRGDPDWLS